MSRIGGGIRNAATAFRALPPVNASYMFAVEHAAPLTPTCPPIAAIADVWHVTSAHLASRATQTAIPSGFAGFTTPPLGLVTPPPPLILCTRLAKHVPIPCGHHNAHTLAIYTHPSDRILLTPLQLCAGRAQGGNRHVPSSSVSVSEVVWESWLIRVQRMAGA